MAADVEDLWRACAPQVLGALVRRFGDFDRAEDAVQEALLAASRQWPEEGAPDNPQGWLITVASRRLVDQWRSETSRAEREERARREDPAPGVAPEATGDRDDSLALLLLCCHPEVPPPSQVALTLRALGGLTTAQIARAFLVPEATMAQRISRAKSRLRDADARLGSLAPDELPDRVAAVAHVLYLIFTEGHTATTGDQLTDVSLADEAIRLTRQLHGHLPASGEVSGLLALMLLTDARRDARVGDDGALVPLDAQDRTRWHQASMAEGVRLVEEALPHGRVGRYQLQAAIAAVHAEAPTAAETDWPQIEVLYRMLADLDTSPVVRLNHAVAVAETAGPDTALMIVDGLADDPALRRQHRVHAVRAHLLERLDRLDEAAEAYAMAARLATSIPEQRYLNERLERVRPWPGAAPRPHR